jgi:superfamily II DNA or RNA helicase
VLLEALLDAIHGEGALHAELAEVARVPGWQRLLAALDRVPRAGAPPRERLVWRLGRSSDGLEVQPVLQQQNARGNWSPGRKLRPEMAVQYRRHGPPEGRPALDAFLGAGHLRHVCGKGAAELRLIEALVDHPLLCSLEPPYLPLQARKVPAALRAALDGEQLEIGVSVGGQSVSVEQLATLMLDERWGVLFARDQVLLFELHPSAYRLLQTIARYGITLPPEAHERAAELLSSLPVQIPVELSQTLRGRCVAAQSTPLLRLSPQGERRLDAELRVRPLEGGPDHLPGEGPPEVFAGVGQGRVWARRDLEQEAERARALAELLGLLPESGNGPRWQLEGDAALELVHRARSLSSAPEQPLVVEWPASTPWQTRSISPGHLRVKVERLGDWFGIEGSIELDGVDTSLALLLAAVRAGQRFVELGPGRFARIEAELAAVASRIDDMAHQHGKKLLLGRASVAALETLGLPQLDSAAEWRALWARIEAARQLEPEPPSALVADLRPYQREGYRWLARLSAWDAGCCLADDMGLGKTVQCLAVLLSRSGPHLVVAPTSVGPNWMREAQAFAPSLRARLYRGPDRAALLSDLAPGDLLVINYDLLTIDIEALSMIEFDTLTLDEAQAVKNARTQRAKAACAIRARFRLALTGTPVENHLGELWSIFSIISPSLLGPWEHFRDRFAAPIERDGDRGRLQALSCLIRPFVLRRTKAVVAPELPPRTSVIEPVELSSRERALYEVARREAIAELATLTGDERGRIQILAALTRLRRLACHPKLVTDGYRGRASKLETLLRLVDELRESGQRALIFSQFTSFLALVREALDAKRIRYLYLDGQTKLTERSVLVDSWKRCDADFFMLSLKAGGSGLNLTGADCVIHLDPWWNPAVEDQATDRTHRIGQERPVTAIRLIAQGTIEEAVIALHEGKRSLADGLLEGTEAAGKLSSAELVDLIRFGEGALREGDPSDDEEDAIETERASSPAPRKPPSAKPSSSLNVDATPRADSGGKPLDVEDLLLLRQRLSRHLADEPITENTVRTYLRAFDRMIGFARNRGGHRPLAGWLDECVTAIDTGQLEAPQSLPQCLSVAVRRAMALGD